MKKVLAIFAMFTWASQIFGKSVEQLSASNPVPRLEKEVIEALKKCSEEHAKGMKRCKKDVLDEKCHQILLNCIDVCAEVPKPVIDARTKGALSVQGYITSRLGTHLTQAKLLSDECVRGRIVPQVQKFDPGKYDFPHGRVELNQPVR